MGIPQPLDHKRFQFISRDKQETSSKVVEFQHKQESTAYYVSCLLAAEAIAYWLKPKKYPLNRHQVLKLLGIKIEAKEVDDDSGELELVKFLEKHSGKQKTKKYETLANYREEMLSERDGEETLPYPPSTVAPLGDTPRSRCLAIEALVYPVLSCNSPLRRENLLQGCCAIPLSRYLLPST